MADYYTELSVELEDKPGWVVQDIRDILLAIEEGDIESAPEWYRKLAPGATEGKDFPSFIDDCLGGPSMVTHELTERGLWIYTEENAGIDSLAHAIHETMKHYNTPGYVTFEWAYTASKPMLDAFGGGAAFISATEITIRSTGDWINEMIEAHESQQKEAGSETR